MQLLRQKKVRNPKNLREMKSFFQAFKPYLVYAAIPLGQCSAPLGQGRLLCPRQSRSCRWLLHLKIMTTKDEFKRIKQKHSIIFTRKYTQGQKNHKGYIMLIAARIFCGQFLCFVSVSRQHAHRVRKIQPIPSNQISNELLVLCSLLLSS